MKDIESRRQFFRRAAIAALVGAITAGTGAGAWAHGGSGRGPMGGGFMGGPMGPGMTDERIERMVGHFAVDVNATPEQKAKLAEIARAAAKELQPLREKAFDARKRAAELLSAPTIDRGAIERLRAEQIQAADALTKRMTQALADAAEVLTPEQRKLAAERFQNRRHGGRGHGGWGYGRG
jgi:Spy/CpxP family protein refolding chaperone